MASRKNPSRRLGTAEILRQVPAARRREKRAREVGLRATGAHYDRATRQVVVELSTGYGFTFPAERVPGLADATAAQRAALELSPSGHSIFWPALDTDASVPGLIEDALGRSAVAKALGRRGGQATSPAKVLAARANGTRGGRPRKDRAV